MRCVTCFVLIVATCTSGTGLADGLITKLPADGAWSLFTVKETIADPTRPQKEPLTVEGTLKIASVGSEKMKGEPCRWIEVVLEANLPGAKESQVTVFKALIAEKFLVKGQDPRTHWLKGWVKLGAGPRKP
jgi:hypothetical protein